MATQSSLASQTRATRRSRNAKFSFDGVYWNRVPRRETSMPRILFKLRTIAGGFALLIVAGAISLWLYGWMIQRQASSLLKDLTEVRVGMASNVDVEKVVQSHRQFLTKKDCRNSTCEYTFTITNHWLSSLHFEPPAEFSAGMTVENGTVIRIGAGLVRTMDIYPSFGGAAGMVDEYTDMPERYARGGHYRFPTPVGKPYLKVVLDRHADAVQRQHAFAFSFRCLTKLGGGCDLSCDYLPLAWRDWRADLQATAFPDFDGVYPNSQRCR
jgi:hypothetical protein